MVAVRHLRVVLYMCGPPTSLEGAISDGPMVVFITVQNLAGIDAVVSIMQVLIFNEFGLKMPIHAPNGCFRGNFTP